MSIWTNLPKGKITNEWEGLDSFGESPAYTPTDLVPKLRCTCGSSITYGEDSPLEFHSIDVCDLHTKVKKEEK